MNLVDAEQSPRGRQLRVIVARVLALAALAALLVAIGRTYVGHSPGPYGACYGESGRTIPCALVAQKK